MSDATDQSESKRKFVMEYNAILGDIELSHNEYQNDYLEKQKDKIIRLAKILDASGHPKENICAKVCKDVVKYDIKPRYVRKILPDEYKDSKFENIEQSNRTIGGPRAASEEEKKQPLLMTNNGEAIAEGDDDDDDDDEVDNTQSKLNEIYGGKTFAQMEREARIEVDEDKEDTLENPQNYNNNNLPLLTSIPPEIREKLAAYDSVVQALEEQKAIADKKSKEYFNLKSAYLQLKNGTGPGIIKGENNTSEVAQLKKKLAFLESELAEIDKEALQKDFEFNEIEVLKIHPDMIASLLDVSRRSQRTCFLVVHPKTMMVKDVRTDVRQHQIQARRNAGVEV